MSISEKNLRIGRLNFNRHNIVRRFDYRIRSIFDKRYKTSRSFVDKQLIVIVTNYCNLSCYSCSATCNTPMGSNPFRDKPDTTRIEYIEALLERFEGHEPDTWVRLSGGEVTLAPEGYLLSVADLVHDYGRKINMITNGANMRSINPYAFDYIELDLHMNNEAAINDTIKYFEEMDYDSYGIVRTQYHRDLELQRTNNTTPATKCDQWMNGLVLWRDIVYPCCVLVFLDGWNHNTEITDDLRAGGWHVGNMELYETLQNYRVTIPAEVLKKCNFGCWVGGRNIINS